MSLGAALSNAASGLRVTARAADLVSSNVANALTPGYARRDLSLATVTYGSSGGVRVASVVRDIDPIALGERRLADASAAGADVLAGALARIEATVGEPSDAGSLSERIARFDSSLVSAASRPDLPARLSEVVDAARGVADGFARIGREIQNVRTRADTEIGQMVERLNAALSQVKILNEQIRNLGGAGRQSGLLQEQRQQVIDGISDIVPLRVLPRDAGMVALVSVGGLVLLDGQARRFEFEPKGIVAPWMTLADGALSGLSWGGTEIDTTLDRSLVSGGALQAQFDLRDRAGPEAQSALDSLARDLVERFQDPTLDPTIAPGAAGLFTDGVGAFVATNEEGLSLRLNINPAVDPSAGGDLWRVRDGIGAAAEGDRGSNDLILALRERIKEPRSPSSGPFAGQARNVASQAAEFLTAIATQRQARDRELSFETARLDALRQREANGAVDTDDEMQKLLTIEQAYGANARVIRTIDALMDQLLRI
jgi:flagellar hook-associated protein 1 FlgK